ncbi:MAG TPA: hypothetical protein VF321_04005 [Gaiellaceae bacterium]
MAEQSHRDEMNAAIRAQRERQAAPRTIAPVAKAPVPEPEPELAVPQTLEEAAPQAPGAAPRKSMLDRLRGR